MEETNGNRESGSKARQYAKNISVLYLYNDVYNVKKIPKHLGCVKWCVIHNPGLYRSHNANEKIRQYNSSRPINEKHLFTLGEFHKEYRSIS